jgi:hypothetical protein
VSDRCATPLRSTVMALLLTVSAGACEGIADPAGERPPNIVQISRPITHGTARGLPWYVPSMESVGACSAVIYKRNWVITAAHCFPGSWDTDGNGIITAAEIRAGWPQRGFVQSAGGPSAQGLSTSFRALRILKPSDAMYADIPVENGNNDIALVELDGVGFFPEALSDFASYYHLNSSRLPVLDLDQWATSTLAPTSLVDNYGWGGGSGMLLHALGAVTSSNDKYYVAGPYMNAGVTQNGDSGGPGFWFGSCVWDPGRPGGSCYYLTGIHSGGGATTSTETSISKNRAWIESNAGK